MNISEIKGNYFSGKTVGAVKDYGDVTVKSVVPGPHRTARW